MLSGFLFSGGIDHWQMPQDLRSVSDHFGTLCIKGVISLTIAKSIFASTVVLCAFSFLFLDFYGFLYIPAKTQEFLKRLF